MLCHEVCHSLLHLLAMFRAALKLLHVGKSSYWKLNETAASLFTEFTGRPEVQVLSIISCRLEVTIFTCRYLAF